MIKDARPIFLAFAVVCLLTIGCGNNERSTPTDPTGGTPKPTPSALLGSWARVSANGTLCSGLVVKWDGTNGTVTSSPAGCDFASGQSVWRNFKEIAPATIEEMACPTCPFGRTSINFSDSSYMNIGGISGSGVGGIAWRKLR